MSISFLNIQYLSPQAIIGFWFLFIGLIFTAIIFYFLFFRLNDDDDSYKVRKRKNLKREKQKDKIVRIYPKKIERLGNQLFTSKELYSITARFSSEGFYLLS